MKFFTVGVALGTGSNAENLYPSFYEGPKDLSFRPF